MSCADVGHGISVGNFATCNQRGRVWPRTIHIGRTGHQVGNCDCFLGLVPVPGGLVLDYEETALPTLEMIETVAAYARPPGKLFVHCAAGMARSPQFALVAKIARGCEPFQALSDIARGMWAGYHRVPQQYANNLTIILDWAAGQAR